MKTVRTFIGLFLFVSQTAWANCADKIDSLAKAGVPINLMNEMAAKVANHKGKAKAGQRVGLVDFSKSSLEKRFFIIDLETAEVKLHRVAHGKNSSDPKRPEMATKFSNLAITRMSSIGLFHLRPIQSSTAGKALRAEGLESGNDQSADRGILVQGSRFISDAKKVSSTPRSFGSFSVAAKSLPEIRDDLANSLLYAGLSARIPTTNKASRDLKHLLNCSDAPTSSGSRSRAPSSISE